MDDRRKTQVDYNRASQRRKREAGLVRCEVWVPAAAREQLRAYAARLRGAGE